MRIKKEIIKGMVILGGDDRRSPGNDGFVIGFFVFLSILCLAMGVSSAVLSPVAAMAIGLCIFFVLLSVLFAFLSIRFRKQKVACEKTINRIIEYGEYAEAKIISTEYRLGRSDNEHEAAKAYSIKYEIPKENSLIAGQTPFIFSEEEQNRYLECGCLKMFYLAKTNEAVYVQ